MINVQNSIFCAMVEYQPFSFCKQKNYRNQWKFDINKNVFKEICLKFKNRTEFLRNTLRTIKAGFDQKSKVRKAKLKSVFDIKIYRQCVLCRGNIFLCQPNKLNLHTRACK